MRGRFMVLTEMPDGSMISSTCYHEHHRTCYDRHKTCQCKCHLTKVQGSKADV